MRNFSLSTKLVFELARRIQTRMRQSNEAAKMKTLLTVLCAFAITSATAFAEGRRGSGGKSSEKFREFLKKNSEFRKRMEDQRGESSKRISETEAARREVLKNQRASKLEPANQKTSFPDPRKTQQPEAPEPPQTAPVALATAPREAFDFFNLRTKAASTTQATQADPTHRQPASGNR